MRSAACDRAIGSWHLPAGMPDPDLGMSSLATSLGTCLFRVGYMIRHEDNG